MKKRLFVAFILPNKLKSDLVKYSSQFSSDNFRLTKKANFHITVLFLGYVEEKHFNQICKSLEEISFSTKPFSLELKSVELAPPKTTKTMAWLIFKDCADYSNLVKKTHTKLKPYLNQKVRLKRIPHVTLLRSSGEISKLDISSLEQFSMEAKTLGLYESKQSKTGSKYKLLKSFKLEG